MHHPSHKRAATLIFILLVFLVVLALPALAQTCSGGQVLTAPACSGDAASPGEASFLQLVNKYRTANGKPEIKLSVPLSKLANRHLLDLKLNMKTVLTHSWSNCPYDEKNDKTWGCIMDSPQRLNSGYKGRGFETLYRASAGTADPRQALEAWSKSSLHNSILLNLGMFKDMDWEEVGVGFDGQFVALWFGSTGTGKGLGGATQGLGATLDQAVAGLSKIFAINQAGATVEGSKWQGTSGDKKIKLEIYGLRSDISEANLAITMKLEAGKLSSQAQTSISTLLKNLFPDWADRDAWVAGAIAAIAANPTVNKTKLVRKVAVEFRGVGPGQLKISIKPESQKGYVEIF